VGSVYEFAHSPEQAKLLKRNTSVLECAVIAMAANGAGNKAVQQHLAKHKVPAAFQGNARTVTMTVRRRNTNAPDKLDLTKAFPIAEQLTFAATFAQDAKGRMLGALSLPSFKGKVSNKKIRPGVHFKFIEPSPEPAPPPSPPPSATQEEQGFLDCFLPCLAGLGVSATPLAGAFCAACITTIAALPPTAGLDTPAVIFTCGSCFFLFLAPITTCFALCQDQL
jgi:hypothetical protein